MWDIGGDLFDSFEAVEVLEVASLSLDEPDMEMGHAPRMPLDQLTKQGLLSFAS
ncbi:hypothetical protein PVK06_028412 [Gossypium arboreum]|uniref:Uncharacterized protein n=1 Tax=Gossypium arboreum TaxID=29729 RepID=A0ABR0P4H0_GOSAR|nr:hypothetical protein PVK06_028412 [Gossypium arboreum]